MRTGTFIQAGVLGAVLVGACAAPPPPTPPPVPADTTAYGPLPETGRMLELRLAEAEESAERGAAVPASRLASLRMTRSAAVLIEEGSVERALALLERALAIDGSTGFPYLYIGYIHLQAGRTVQARTFIERGAALMPLYPPLENELQALRLAARVEDAAVRRTP
ncbi:MAG: hypothetical protein V3R77_08355 [Candidatus Binatia bacterium]